MAVKVMAAVFDARGLRATEKLVLLALADHANEAGRHIYPSVATICDKTALSERTVRSTLKDLRQKGVLIVVEAATAHFPTEYAIDLEALLALEEGGRSCTPKDEKGAWGAGDAPQGRESCTPGVQEMQGWGAGDAPKPLINHHLTVMNQKMVAALENFKRDSLLKNPTWYHRLIKHLALAETISQETPNAWEVVLSCPPEVVGVADQRVLRAFALEFGRWAGGVVTLQLVAR